MFYLLTPTFSPSLRYTSLEPTRNRRPADSRNCRKSCNSLDAASLIPDILRDSPDRSGYTREESIRTASRTATVTDCNSCVCLKTLCTFHTRTYSHASLRDISFRTFHVQLFDPSVTNCPSASF